jgi:Fur family ferric uptake transcriptional regulator
MKHSLKREKIIKLFEKCHLLTATDICLKLSDIDRATIYRNLSLLVGVGILREVHINKDITSYEKAGESDHQHFVCSNCDKVLAVEVDANKFKELLPNNIKLEDFELNLKGKCSNCI